MSYGYAEARMQLPAGNAEEDVWPSFWLTGHTWPDDMEIDVIEGDGTDEGCKFNIHYGSDGVDSTTLDDDVRQSTVPGATTGMHTYAADIRPDGVTFYYDGVAVYSYDGDVPDKSRYLMVGLSTAGTMSSTKSLDVDYVRAWTRD
jgi:beta-glucanase (GH16 family)